MGKIGLKPIFCAYVNTLRDDSSGKYSYADIILQIILPIVVGVAMALLLGSGKMQWPCFDNSITVVSIVSSLLCALALMLFSLRGSLAEKHETEARAIMLELHLIDELFADVMWCVVAGFAAALLMTVSGMVDTFPFCIGVFAAAVSITMLINFALVACMCLKRMNAAYKIVSHARQRKG